MALNYSVSLRSSNPTDPEALKKAYAKAQIGSNISLKTMSKRIASQTTVARADVMAVLTALVDNSFEVLREGNQVDLGELGKLRLQICSEGAATLKEFTSDYITGVNIQFVPGEDLKNIFAGMDFNPVPTRAAAAAVLKAQKEGETTVDISPKQADSPEPVVEEEEPVSIDN